MGLAPTVLGNLDRAGAVHLGQGLGDDTTDERLTLELVFGVGVANDDVRRAATRLRSTPLAQTVNGASGRGRQRLRLGGANVVVERSGVVEQLVEFRTFLVGEAPGFGSLEFGQFVHARSGLRTRVDQF